jgi:hypothetical protein
MANRPTIKLVDNPVAVGGITAAPDFAAKPLPVSPSVTEPVSEASPKRARKPRQTPAPKPAAQPQNPVPAASAATNPYAGMRKVQIPVRLFPPLWDRLDELVRVLSDENLDVDKTALLNAMLHFNGPATTDDARELVNRWRALLASPPARPR